MTLLHCPVQATQEVVSRLPQTTEREFNAAVEAAKDAYPKWRNTALPTRSRVMFKLQELIRQHMVRLAEGAPYYGCKYAIRVQRSCMSHIAISQLAGLAKCVDAAGV